MKKLIAFFAIILLTVFVITACDPAHQESAPGTSSKPATSSNSTIASNDENSTTTPSEASDTSETTSLDVSAITVEYGSTLKSLIDAGWTHDSVTGLFGDSVFLRLYHNFTEDGVKVRFTEQYSDSGSFKNYDVNLTGNVENIIFGTDFKGEIFKGITMKSKKQDIVKALGAPHFTDDSTELFGYRTKNCYAFFYGKTDISEVSIYPIYKMSDIKVLFEEIKSLCAKSEHSQTLAADIAKLVCDEYGFYNYNYSFEMNVYQNSPERSQSTAIAYYGNGIHLRYSNASGANDPMLIVYNSSISDELRSLITAGIKDKNSKVIVGLDDNRDLAFEHEKERVSKEKEYTENLNSNGVVSPNGNIILHYEGSFIYANDSGINVFNKDDSAKSFTIIASPWEGNIYWLNDRYFIYGYSKNYINVYDLKTNKQVSLGTNITPVQVKDNKITVNAGDGTAEIRFSFKSNGDIQLESTSLTLTIDWS